MKKKKEKNITIAMYCRLSREDDNIEAKHKTFEQYKEEWLKKHNINIEVSDEEYLALLEREQKRFFGKRIRQGKLNKEINKER